MTRVQNGSNGNRRLTQRLAKRASAANRARREAIALAEAASEPDRTNYPEGNFRLETVPIELVRTLERPVSKEKSKRVAQAVALSCYSGILPPLLLSRELIVLGDHLSLEAARAKGLTEITCVIANVDLSPEQVRLINVALHHQAASLELDPDNLAYHLSELIEVGAPIELTGIDAPQIEILLAGARLIDERMDDVPLVEAQIVSRLGDMWLMEPHRCRCGDATLDADYAPLMDGQRAGCVIADSPYNIRIEGNVSGNGKVKHKDFVQGVGEWSEDEFSHFLATYIRLSADHTRDGAAIFAFMDHRSLHLLIPAGKSAGLKHVTTCIWHKGGGAYGSPYRSAHENIAVFAKGKLAVDNVELGRHGRNRTNVWEYPGANRPGTSAAQALALHSTPKNVEMIADAIRDVTQRGDIVLDPFLGSGTTIIAAEATDRICYGLELDPQYVDVIVRRWEQQTGRAAIHAETGLTFSKVAKSRSNDCGSTR